MASELRKAQILDQFVDDLNSGRMPRVYELMAAGDEDLAELIPLLDFAGWFKSSAAPVPADERVRIEAEVMDKARSRAGATNWTMQRLVEESDPRIVAQGIAAGLSPIAVDAVSSDTTPLDLEDPNEVVARLAREYKIQFYSLLKWVRQLISNALGNQPGVGRAVIYARDGGREKDNHPEQG